MSPSSCHQHHQSCGCGKPLPCTLCKNGAPRSITLEISGVTNSVGGGCLCNYNGTWELLPLLPFNDTPEILAECSYVLPQPGDDPDPAGCGLIGGDASFIEADFVMAPYGSVVGSIDLTDHVFLSVTIPGGAWYYDLGPCNPTPLVPVELLPYQITNCGFRDINVTTNSGLATTNTVGDNGCTDTTYAVIIATANF